MAIIAKHNTLPDFSSKKKIQVEPDEVIKAKRLTNRVNEDINKILFFKKSTPVEQPDILKIGETYLYVPEKKRTVDFYLQFYNKKVKIIGKTDDNTKKTYYKKEALHAEDKDKCIYYVQPINDPVYTFYARAESLKPLNDDLQVNQYYWYNPDKSKSKPAYWMYSGYKVKLIEIGGTRSNGYPGDALGDGSDCVYLVVMEEQGNWTFRTRKNSLKKV